MLDIVISTTCQVKKNSPDKLTKRPKAWNILSDVPSGLLKKYLANNTSSSLLYRIFLSGGAGSGSSPSERASSCLCLRQNFIHEAREWCGAYRKKHQQWPDGLYPSNDYALHTLAATSFQNATISRTPCDLRYSMNRTRNVTSSCVNATPLPVVLRYKARGGVGERFRWGAAAAAAVAADISNLVGAAEGAGACDILGPAVALWCC